MAMSCLSRLNNSNPATMDEMDEQYKDNSREYEAEQPSLCESIAMGVVSSGLLPGSAPVNIPRTGLTRPPRLTPSPPNLNNLLPVGHQEVTAESTNNPSSLFFNNRVCSHLLDRNRLRA